MPLHVPTQPTLSLAPSPRHCCPASETTQGLGLGDMFTRDPASGALRPVLEELQVPVRAVVLPLTDAAASK